MIKYVIKYVDPSGNVHFKELQGAQTSVELLSAFVLFLRGQGFSDSNIEMALQQTYLPKDTEVELQND